MSTLPYMSVWEIKTGDLIASTGGRRVSSVSGKVLKANPKTLLLETSYMGNPMELRVRRDDLDGEVRIKRGEIIYSNKQ